MIFFGKYVVNAQGHHHTVSLKIRKKSSILNLIIILSTRIFCFKNSELNVTKNMTRFFPIWDYMGAQKAWLSGQWGLGFLKYILTIEKWVKFKKKTFVFCQQYCQLHHFSNFLEHCASCSEFVRGKKSQFFYRKKALLRL